MTVATVDMYRERFDLLETQKQPYERDWQEIQDTMAPFIGDITTKTEPGARRTTGVYDTAAIIAADRFVNFMKNAMLPSDSQWMRTIVEAEFQDNLEIGELLDTVTMKTLAWLTKSNFYVASGSALLPFSLIGNSNIQIQERKIKSGSGRRFGGFYFESIPASDYWWSIGEEGEPEMIAVRRCMTAQQVIKKFARPGKFVMDAYARSPMETLEVVHFCHENEDYAPKGLPSRDNKPFTSTWIVPGNHDWDIVDSGGFEIMPYAASRYTTMYREHYGRGRGHIARADVNGMQQLKKLMLLGLGRDVLPTLYTPNDDSIQLNGRPGGRSTFNHELEKPFYLHSGTPWREVLEFYDREKNNINEALLSDVLSEPDTEPRSALESQMKSQRALRRLAAPADIVAREFLDRLMGPVIHMLHRAGELPELNRVAEIAGRPVDIEFTYVSQFFTAQRQEMLQRVNAFIEQRVLESQAMQDPGLLDDIDWDETNRLRAEVADVPKRIFLSEEEIEEAREARADQQATAEALEIQKAMGGQEASADGGGGGAVPAGA